MKRHLAVLAAALLGSPFMSGLAPGQTPSALTSFFVPQIGSVAAPTEGPTAVRSFRTCPNLDGVQILNNNARIKITLNTSGGVPIQNVAASDIFVRLSGGVGDSVVTDGANCPAPQYLFADGPTNSSGVTYITFIGSSPGNPGVALRNPARKWGHYDSELPVFALGVQLLGRLVSNGNNGDYVLRIKNVDFFGGTSGDPNAKEEVSSREYNSMVNSMFRKDPMSYWRDLSGDGIINTLDLNFLLAHMRHDCDTPNAN